MGTLVGTARRDVERDVPEKSHAPFGRISAQLGPFPLEADLILDGGKSLPATDPIALTFPELGHGRT